MKRPPLDPLEIHHEGCPWFRGDACNCRPAPRELWGIFDMDGCICDDRHRRFLADIAHAEKNPEAKDKAYIDYHSYCHRDPRRPVEAALLVAWREHRPWHRVAIVTGRNFCFFALTTKWLQEEGLLSSIDMILMRPNGDRRPAAQVKTEIVRGQLLNLNQRVAFAFDDDPDILSAYRILGIPALRSYDL